MLLFPASRPPRRGNPGGRSGQAGVPRRQLLVPHVPAHVPSQPERAGVLLGGPDGAGSHRDWLGSLPAGVGGGVAGSCPRGGPHRHHREWNRRDRRWPEDHLPQRPPPGGPPSDPGRDRHPRVLLVVPDGQLRVARGAAPQVRAVPGRLPDVGTEGHRRRLLLYPLGPAPEDPGRGRSDEAGLTPPPRGFPTLRHKPIVRYPGFISAAPPPGRRGTLRTGAPRWGSNRSVSPLPVSEKTTAGRANLPPGRDERKKEFLSAFSYRRGSSSPLSGFSWC